MLIETCENVEIERIPNQDLGLDIFIKVRGEGVGSAELERHSIPCPFIEVDNLFVNPAVRGKGYASLLLEEANRFILEQGVPGFLLDTIPCYNPARGIYSRHGWKGSEKSYSWYFFNAGGLNTTKIREILDSLRDY